MKMGHRFALTAVIAFLTCEYFILGKYSYLMIGDEGDSILAAMVALPQADALRPLWYPFAAAGADRLAFGYIGDFQVILFTLLPKWLAYQLIHVGMVAGMVAGTWVLARTRLGLEPWPALFAAFASGQSLELRPLYCSVIAFTPWVVICLFHLLDRRDSPVRWVIAVTVAILWSTSSYLAFLLVFPALYTAIWVLCARRTLRPGDWLIVAGFFILVYLLRIQDLWAMMANAPLSHRAHWTHHQPGIGEPPFEVLGRLVVSQVSSVMGILWAGLTLLALLNWRSLGQGFVTIILAMGVTAVTMLIIAWGIGPASAIFPPIQSFSSERLWNYSFYLMPLAAAFGLQSLKGLLAERPARIALIACMAVVAGQSLHDKVAKAAPEWISGGNWVANYQSPVLEALRRRIDKGRTPERVVSFDIQPAFSQTYGLEGADGYITLYPQAYHRFWSTLAEPSRGLDPEYDHQIFEWGHLMMLGATFNVDRRREELALADFARLKLLSLANVRYVISRTRLTDPGLVDLNLGNPRKPWTTMTSWEKIRVNAQENFFGRTNLHVYENQAALPRFFFAQSLVPKPDDDAVLEAVVAESLESLALHVPVNASRLPPGAAIGPFVGGTPKIIHHGADRIRLEVDPDPSPRLLVALNSYAPGWRAFADGVSLPIFPAYGTFWGVMLPPHTKGIEFHYQPPYRWPSQVGGGP